MLCIAHGSFHLLTNCHPKKGLDEENSEQIQSVVLGWILGWVVYFYQGSFGNSEHDQDDQALGGIKELPILLGVITLFWLCTSRNFSSFSERQV